METPAQRETLNKDRFRDWLRTISFASSGDDLERRAFHLLSDFPRLEEFWRVFVVPLTGRLKGIEDIECRSGVDPNLQSICAANYTLFVHLIAAKTTLTNWGETSLYTVYTRLGSAFDVFESLVVKFHLLLCECRGLKSPLLSELSEEAFVQRAKEYFQKKYHRLLELYQIKGKAPMMNAPIDGDIFAEYFGDNSTGTTYGTISRQVREFRNVIVHDIHVGGISVRGQTLVPKTDKILKYRRWSDIQKVWGKEDIVAKDFCEVKTQCGNEIARTADVLNALYEKLLKDFNEEFYNPKHSGLRDLFGIEFKEDSIDVSISRERAIAARSSSSADTSIPAPASGTLSIPPKIPGRD